ncbi:MAG TPA: LysE family translocator [Streptosporangiaceae bacterium]|nr:LysE family translocator [Streptosporangiaceae bacterium]
MSTHLLALYVAAVFLAMIAPGPDMMFVLATGMRGGARAGLLATLGVVSSEIVQIAAVAAGLSALFAEAPVAFTVLRLGGAAYLLYLGVQALRSARRGSPLEDSQPGARVSWRYAYLRGAVTNLVNPKSVTFVVALLPQFVDRGLGHIPLQFAVLGAIFVAFEVLVDGTVGLASGRIGGWLSRRRRARQALDAGSGTIMVALAGRLALER